MLMIYREYRKQLITNPMLVAKLKDKSEYTTYTYYQIEFSNFPPSIFCWELVICRDGNFRWKPEIGNVRRNSEAGNFRCKKYINHNTVSQQDLFWDFIFYGKK